VTQAVIVPAWHRADFLTACLHRLALADRPHLHYLISLDRGYHLEVGEVASEFRHQMGTHRVTILRRHDHRYRGNSYNVLEAYRYAAQTRTTLIHLVEEDIFVGHDYFDYHDDAHLLNPEAFCVSAVRNQAWPPGVEPPPDDTAFYQHGSYQSLGVSFRPDIVRRFIAHATTDYYRDSGRYLRASFPASRIHGGHTEQDGLINRVREKADLISVYPHTPRAYHAGYFGYNRSGHWNGDGADESRIVRAAMLLTMGADELNIRALHYPDFTTVDLDAPRERLSRRVDWHP